MTDHFSSEGKARQRQCYLLNVENPESKIYLPDKREVHVGRNRLCQIRDLAVSRMQMLCVANIAAQKLLVKITGTNPSTCNGYGLQQLKFYEFKHGDRIEFVVGRQAYDIIFDEGSANKISNSLESSRTKNKLEMNKNNLNKSDAEPWEKIDNGELLIFTPNGCVSTSLIAGFDIDGTIIKTKSGARFPKDSNDWVLNFPSIHQKLKELQENKYKVVFFTNQLNLNKDLAKTKEFKKKIEHIVTKLNIPVQVFVATSRSRYRKPVPGMWSTLCECKNDDIPVDLDKSFYVGDAAGREKNWAPKRNKDHSNCDRLFASNIGIKFYTPEEYFLSAPKVKYVMPEFDPKKITFSDIPDCLDNKEQEVILMVGAQGSGKSYFCKTKLIPKGYIYINRDELGSWQKCVKKLEKCLQDGISAVIDNTNPDKQSRAKYIEVVAKYGVKCRCFQMKLSLKHCKHNNRFRELIDKSHAVINEILINSYNKNFQEPELSEGFTEIVKIPFVPEFKNPEHEKLYKLYLLES